MTTQDDHARQPCRERFRVTLARTGAIALALGAVLAWRMGGLAYLPMATLMAFWPSFGGHWVELFFLNFLRPRLPRARAVQSAVRILVWFIGGIVLAFGMTLTAKALAGNRPAAGIAWWAGGLGFVGIELVVHLVLQLRGRQSFYNGCG